MFGSDEYVADPTEGIGQVEELPSPHRKNRTRHRKSASCPVCRRRRPRSRTGTRTLHDLGNRETGRPVELEFHFSIHRCKHCQKYFGVDLSDVVAPGSLYTQRVVELAVRVVVEDGFAGVADVA